MNDKDRFKNFLKILPEKTMDKIWSQLDLGFIDSLLLDHLQNYSDYSEKILNKFDDLLIDKVYEKLNTSFREMHNFIRQDFFIDKDLRKSKLQPELKGNDEKRVAWNRKLEALVPLIDNVKNDYNLFLKAYRIRKNSISEFVYDPDSHLVIYKDKSMIIKGKKRLKFINYLSDNWNRICSAEEINKAMYNINSASDSDFNKMVSAINKLAKNELKTNQNLIVRSDGYRLA